MKAIGIVRCIDNLGRITIPKEVRKVNGWECGDPMEMFISEQGFIVRKYEVDDEKEKLINDLEYAADHASTAGARKILQRALEFIEKN